MGGRMSGESPRDEKLVVRKCTAGAERPYQMNCAVEAAIATVGEQVSGQQFIAWEPEPQQVWCAAARWLSAAEAQSARSGAMSAKAATDPCRAMTSINMIEMTVRGMREEYVTWASNGKYRRRIDTSCTVFEPANGVARHR